MPTALSFRAQTDCPRTATEHSERILEAIHQALDVNPNPKLEAKQWKEWTYGLKNLYDLLGRFDDKFSDPTQEVKVGARLRSKDAKRMSLKALKIERRAQEREEVPE